MKPWKERGFVQDSDEEGYSSSETRTSPPARDEELESAEQAGKEAAAAQCVEVVIDRSVGSPRKCHTDQAGHKAVENVVANTGEDAGEVNGPGPTSSASDMTVDPLKHLFSSSPPRESDERGQIPSSDISSSELSELSERQAPSTPSSFGALDLSPKRAEPNVGRGDQFARTRRHEKPRNLPHSSMELGEALPPTIPRPASMDDGRQNDSEVHPEHGVPPSTVVQQQRNLRKRREIQLHPFQIERNLRQREALARGLPGDFFKVHGEKSSGTSSHRKARSGSAERAATLSESLALSSLSGFISDDPSSSNVSDSGTATQQSVAPLVQSAVRIEDSDDDLPEVAELLRGQVPQRVQLGTKRRKITHTNQVLKQPPPQSAAILETVRDGNTAADDNIFDGPMSPPTNQHVSLPRSTSIKRAKFRKPRPLQSDFDFQDIPEPKNKRPQSPEVSRSRSKRPRLRSSPNAVSPKASMTPLPRQAKTPTVVITSDESSASDAESGRHRSVEMRDYQKKIKGVLPASWLRLDHQDQAKKQEQAARLLESRRQHDSADKGVAKRLKRTGLGSSTGLPQNPLDVWADSDDDPATGRDSPAPQLPSLPMSRSTSPAADEAVPSNNNHLIATSSARPPPAQARYRQLGLEMLPFDDIEENDWIDSMGPSTATRKRKVLRRDGKRQTKLADSFDHPSNERVGGSHGFRNILRRSRTKTMKTPGSKTRRPKHRPLSILDVEHDQSLSGDPEPLFLRLAKRNARKREDRGQDSPTRKAIRLQTRADTEDANEPLRAWREGTLSTRRNKKPRSSYRKPLAPLSENPLQCPPAPDKVASRHRGYEPLSAVPSRRKPLDGSQTRLRQTQLRANINQPQQTDLTTAPNRSSTSGPKPAGWGRRLLKSNLNFLPAQLEALAPEFDGSHQQTALQRHLRNQEQLAPVERFVAQASTAERTIDHAAGEQEGAGPPRTRSDAAVTQISKHSAHRARKRPPRRLDAGLHEYWQPVDPLPVARAPSLEGTEPDGAIIDGPRLQGLGPHGARFPVDFHVRPLERGTYFHESTFVGSTDLQRCLSLRDRNLDVVGRAYDVPFRQRSFRWQSWNENVLEEMSTIFTQLNGVLEAQNAHSGRGPDDVDSTLCLLQHVNRYVANSLSFSDSVDRQPFLDFMLMQLDWSHAKALQNGDIPSGHLLGLLSQVVILCYQVYIVAEQSPRSFHASKLCDLMKSLGCYVAKAFVASSAPIWQFHEDNRRHQIREAGIRGHGIVEAFVEMATVFPDADRSSCTLWDLFNEILIPEVQRTTQLETLEKTWEMLFLVLPLLEFDSSGLVNKAPAGSTSENWSLVKELLSRVFELYPNCSSLQRPTFNSYIRAVLARCCHLVSFWKWRKCEAVLSVAFDFFAQRNLADLTFENATRSPLFLEALDDQPSLVVQPDDSAFHVFLRLLGAGLQSMREVYPGKKIQNIAWRFVPGHGRMCPKEESVRQEDLDALRNHHDVLSVLYWASPPGFRPRLDLIERLVDHTTSHSEACRLNIRAWSNLARFQTSTEEAVEAILPFCDWFNRVAERTMAQYHLAEAEAESQKARAKGLGGPLLSDQFVRSIVEKNQRQVLATIAGLVGGLKSAVKASSSEQAAATLVEQSHVSTLFSLRDAESPAISGLMVETISVYSEFLKLCKRRRNTEGVEQSSEESQDYGAWPEDDEDNHAATAQPVSTAVDHVSALIEQQISNSFGSDKAPSDAYLTALVRVWVECAEVLVAQGDRDWDTYLEAYGPHSWTKLQQTEQTRRYGPLYYANIIEANAASASEDTVMCAWLVSLVERDSVMKFQHLLTTALLNAHASFELLANLPFASDRAGRFDVSLRELRSRRLSLISCILSNMRDSYEAASAAEKNKLRSAYTGFLKQLMAAMRHNFLGLQQGDRVTGAYVSFVQAVIEFMQQHTSEICPVDRFFTDSLAFPLPASDPTYVAGRLKGYSPKLGLVKTQKSLATFIQSVSERAAADNQQPYLVDQLARAILAFPEDGNADSPSLLTVLVGTVFPTYMELSLSTPSGWVPAKPILQATSRVFGDLFYSFSLHDSNAALSIAAVLRNFLTAAQHALGLLASRSDLLELAQVRCMVALIFGAITPALPSIDYIQRCTGSFRVILSTIRFFSEFGSFATATFAGQQDCSAPDSADAGCEPQEQEQQAREVREFCRRHLEDSLARSWRQHGDRIFVGGCGGARREVLVELGSAERERDGALDAIARFESVLSSLPSLAFFAGHGRRRTVDLGWTRRHDVCTSGVVV